jgi:hypothetical protein
MVVRTEDLYDISAELDLPALTNLAWHAAEKVRAEAAVQPGLPLVNLNFCHQQSVHMCLWLADLRFHRPLIRL